MADYIDAEGRIEALGNSEIQKNGTLYSLVKLRGADGKVETLTDVVFARCCNVEAQVGEDVRLLGFPINKNIMVFGLRSDGEVTDDVAEISKARGPLTVLGLSMMAMGVLTIWTIIIPIMVLPSAIRCLRNASAIPSEVDMRREIAARLSS